jgi:hypothetical protein
MAEQLLNVRLERPVDFSLSTLREEEQRLVEGWFDHLRRWHTDDFIRSHSRKLKPDEEIYAFQTDTSNLIFVFTIKGDEATIVSVFTKEALEQFRAASAVA